MGDIGSEFLNIRDALKSKHQAYVGRFGTASTRHIGSEHLMMTRVLAKLKLVAAALSFSGAIDEIEEQDVKSKDGDFPMSIRVGKKNVQHSVYLLNDVEGVIVSGSVSLASGLGTIDGMISIALDDSKVCKKFRNVLSPAFDWKELCLFALDAVHEVVYSRRDVILESVLDDGVAIKKICDH